MIPSLNFRFVAIQMPYKYLDMLTSRTLKLLLITVWGFSGFWSIMGIYKWRYAPTIMLPQHQNNLHTNITSNISTGIMNTTSSFVNINVSQSSYIEGAERRQLIAGEYSVYSIHVIQVNRSYLSVNTISIERANCNGRTLKSERIESFHSNRIEICQYYTKNLYLYSQVSQDSKKCLNNNIYYYLVCFYGIYVPVLLIMTCVYIKILHVAVTQIRKIKQHTNPVIGGMVMNSPPKV